MYSQTKRNNKMAIIVPLIILSLTKPMIGYAKTYNIDQEKICLAKVIYHEARGESDLGKKSVAKIVINRKQHRKFPKTICQVVNQVAYIGRKKVCQFSWVCAGYARQPNPTDERWVESREIAQRLADGEFPEYQAKYANALFFHASAIRPVWAKTKKIVSRTGHHIFYE